MAGELIKTVEEKLGYHMLIFWISKGQEASEASVPAAFNNGGVEAEQSHGEESPAATSNGTSDAKQPQRQDSPGPALAANRAASAKHLRF